MKALLRASLVAIGCFSSTLSIYGQVSAQSRCARKVARDMAATRKERPEAFATIGKYLFEWSKSRQACVTIIQYRTKENGQPMIQILAMNEVTAQPMEGYKDIFLVPEGDEKQIEDATNFLFEKYSH